MFCAEVGEPTRYTSGFFDFFDDNMKRLMRTRESGARLIAHHVIAPALAPSDKEAFLQVSQGTMDASEVIGSPYKQRIAAARVLGCATVRLQITQGNKDSTPLDGALLSWQRDICGPINTEVGEGCRIAWWDEQKGRLAAILADDAGQTLLDEFTDGITQDVPVGGHWALYSGADTQELLTVAEVKYGKDEAGVRFKSFDAYAPDQLTAATRRYVDFWSGVISTQESVVLHSMVPLP
jgi:hypothetical protein